MLTLLPPEIIFKIISFTSYKDISSLRQVSKILRTFCDHPTNWRTVRLHVTGHLWKLTELRSILDPHLSLIRSIYIWDVRDSIVQYLLSSCRNLEHLTVCGWNTLSDHSLRLPSTQPLKIKTLKLIGSSIQSNYVSIDAYALSNLLAQSPHMTSIVLGCDIHIHAETLVTELEQKIQSRPSLKSLILASRRTWLNEHVLRLVKVYPCLQSIYLLSNGIINADTNDSNIVD
jgi:hypothetical protein